MKKTAVVILNYNGEKYLAEFIPEVVAHSDEADIVVIDNLSTDNSINFLKENHPTIKIIQLSENKGFAEGYNTGLKQLQEYEYWTLLNSDVKVTTGWLKPIRRFEEQLDVAVIQPKILSYHQPEYFEYAGAAGGQLDYLGYPFCKGRVFGTLEKDQGQFEKDETIFWASGACYFVRSKVFMELGGFDPDFFAHMEEIDLCWRIKNAGHLVWYAPEAKVFHVGAGTLHSDSPFKTYLNFRNNLLMLTKNLPKNQLFKIIFARLILDGISGIKFMLSGQISLMFAIVRAHFSYYFRLFNTIKKRDSYFHAYSECYPKSVVYQYFIKNNKTFNSLPS